MTDQGNNNGAIETRLRVLTWNIWWRFGPWERRQPAIAATLARLDADVIALQEVWSDETTNLAAELATELGYQYVFASSMEMKGFGFGNALLSRWPITRSESVKLHGQKETGEGRRSTAAMCGSVAGFLMKLLKNVRTEMALSVLAYNLTRVMNILGIRPLIAAIRA
jgi:endonuclease/exonuclease/phosphatase family metal-dependent hydrolase